MGEFLTVDPTKRDPRDIDFSTLEAAQKMDPKDGLSQILEGDSLVREASRAITVEDISHHNLDTLDDTDGTVEEHGEKDERKRAA